MSKPSDIANGLAEMGMSAITQVLTNNNSMSKERKSMPNKIGKVGRKKMAESEKKILVYTHKKKADIDLIGGQKKVNEDISNFLDSKISLKRGN